jgi:hypothetical protein
MTLAKRIEELERKVKELEARPPVMIPIYMPPMYPVYPQPALPYWTCGNDLSIRAVANCRIS